jgi:hypothetical protein
MFKGVYEYFEHLLARIDSPRLGYPNITFSMVLDFDVPHLRQFIGHAEEFNTFDRAYLWIYDPSIHLYLYPHPGAVDHRGRFELRINMKVDSLTQFQRVKLSAFMSRPGLWFILPPHLRFGTAGDEGK